MKRAVAFVIIASVLFLSLVGCSSNNVSKQIDVALDDVTDTFATLKIAVDGEPVSILDISYKKAVDGNISEITALRLIPADENTQMRFGGNVSIWLREDNKIEYAINGDYYLADGSRKKVLTENASLNQEYAVCFEATNLTDDYSMLYIYKHGTIGLSVVPE